MESLSDRNRRTWKDPIIREKRIQGNLNTRYGDNVDRKEYYFNVVKPLIYQGYTRHKMVSENLIDCSSPTIFKQILKYGSEEDIEFHKNNCVKNRAHGKNKGKPSPLKGKTYEEIFQSDEKADKRRKQTSDWMKTDKNIRRYATKISKGQILLYGEILKIFPDAILEYSIPKANLSGNYFLDIAVIDKKLDFEFDGSYWHSLPGIPEQDLIRDQYLTSLGWKVFRCSFHVRNPLEVETELLKLKSQLYDKDII